MENINPSYKRDKEEGDGRIGKEEEEEEGGKKKGREKKDGTGRKEQGRVQDGGDSWTPGRGVGETGWPFRDKSVTGIGTSRVIQKSRR